MGNHIVFITGCLFCIYLFFSFIYSAYPYLKGSELKKYLKDDTFALVTGSTDGIGKAIALALAEKGSNIILHGRNETKLNAVASEIHENYPGCRVVCFNHDGSKGNQLDTEKINQFNITILVNNVGVGPIGQLAASSNAEIAETIRLNTLFPSQLTHNLLPQLSRQPSLILNVSSYAGIYPPPYLAVYAATKAYNNAFSVSLSRELDNTEVISLITGSVNTGSNTKPVTFMRPSAATYARHILSIVGCGRKSIMPYWPHAIQRFIISLLPEKIIDYATKTEMQKELNPSA